MMSRMTGPLPIHRLDIDYQKTTINGQKIEEYESGHLLPYSDEDLLNTGLDENVYDAVLESRFSLDGDLGEIQKYIWYSVPYQMKSWRRLFRRV